MMQEMEKNLNEHLVLAMRHLAALRLEISQIRRMGPSEMYQNTLRDLDTHLELGGIILEHMSNNPSPLYFFHRSGGIPAILEPTRDGPIPEALRRIIMEDEDV